MNSLQHRLRSGLLALLLSGCLMLYLVVDRALHAFSDSAIRHELEERVALASKLATYWALPPDPDAFQARLRQHDPCPDLPASGYYCQWSFRGTLPERPMVWTHTSPSLSGQVMQLPDMPPGTTHTLYTVGPHGDETVVAVRSVVIASGVLTLATGYSRTVQQHRLRIWRAGNLVLVTLLLVAGSGIIIGYLGVIFGPLRQVQNDAKALEAGLRARMDNRAPEEVQPLLQLVDRLIEARERHADRTRRTLSHLSHALKLPVTALVHLAERPEMTAQPEIRAILCEQTTLMRRLIERQMRRAVFAERMVTGDRFPLGTEIATLVRALESLHYDKYLEIDVRVPPDLLCPGHRDDIIELIGNLADNGCKWARSRVILAAGNEHGFWLTIEDDGVPLTDEALAQLQNQTTSRMDERSPSVDAMMVNPAANSHGLGLWIAGDLVDLYGGKLSLGRSQALGGFMVHVMLPEEIPPLAGSTTGHNGRPAP
jgi:signal transduction histidine kinase